MAPKITVIAEAGVNHNGSMDIAKQLIDAAAAAGADYVKFQTFKAEKLVTRTARKADYQTANTKDGDQGQFNMLKKLELSPEDHIELIAYTEQKNIRFLSTGFDEESVDELDELGIPLFKVPSGEITNKPYLQHIARKGKPVIISTGLSNLEEIKQALAIVINEGVPLEQITVLHCTTEYPAPFNEVNLRAMSTIAAACNVQVGYSDHTEGIEISLAAAAMGAVVIEKHFTLDRAMEGPDHKASLEPAELSALVTGIRKIEQALGDGVKKPAPSELKNKDVARKSIVASKNIKAGEIFSVHNITVKRPGTGISPMLWDEVIGKVSIKDFAADEQVTL